ncbi:hypothetical protein SAMN05421752_1365 [Natronorubrum thiooxidans]|uniref:Uncharacterized protein n=1 Tax=Natronorubrum thiooxidans TaxID=308853 RepID=A0A1N7H9I3_9EURY|nr:hypothetical protein SAMN05421752_1365 [Natronorubrum thiooxidans]
MEDCESVSWPRKIACLLDRGNRVELNTGTTEQLRDANDGSRWKLLVKGFTIYLVYCIVVLEVREIYRHFEHVIECSALLSECCLQVFKTTLHLDWRRLIAVYDAIGCWKLSLDK